MKPRPELITVNDGKFNAQWPERCLQTDRFRTLNLNHPEVFK